MPKILLFVGVCLLSFGFWVPANAGRFIDSSRKVDAVVEEYGPETVEARLPRPARLFLRYQFNGATYRKSVNVVDKYWANLKKGDTVRLILSDTDPGQFASEGAVGRSRSVKILSYFYVALGAALAGLGLFLFRRPA